jgi:hypothetical protein
MKTAGEWADKLWNQIKAGGPRSWHGITVELIRDVREEMQEECAQVDFTRNNAPSLARAAIRAIDIK